MVSLHNLSIDDLRDISETPPSLCADVSKAGALPLGSPSFSILLLKEKVLIEAVGSATMCENVALHGLSPPNFPHTEEEPRNTWRLLHTIRAACSPVEFGRHSLHRPNR